MKKVTKNQQRADAKGDISSDLSLAAELHRKGDLSAAEAIYRRVLAAAPGNVDALHLLGVIHCQAKRFEEALPLLERAVSLAPTFPEARQNLGKALRQLKRHEEAERQLAEVVRLKPDSAEALTDHANTLRKQGKKDEAASVLSRATSLDAGHAPAWLGLAEALRDTRPDEALAAYRRALDLAPTNAAAWNNLGTLLKERGQGAEARAALERAVAEKPDFAEGWNNLGNLLLDADEAEAAIARYREAIRLKPEFHEAHNNLANALKQVGKTAEAIAAYREAIRIAPDFAEGWSNLGNALLDANDRETALDAYRRALSLKPDFTAALNNLAGAHVAYGEIDAALEVFDRALAIDGNFAAVRFGRGLARLLTGNFAEGWRDYEARWEGSNMAGKTRPPKFSYPQWKGEDGTASLRLLLYHEQGLGDTLQFVRYLPMVAKRFREVVFVCQPELVALVKHGLGAGVTVVDSETGTQLARSERFDRHCPLLSLPLAFSTTLATVPRCRPYLMPPPDRQAAWLERARPEDACLRVGLVWAGSPDLKDDRRRSLTLSSLAPLFAIPDITWYSLQKSKGQDALRQPDAHKMTDWGPLLCDFADTAAALAQLDLLVSVDTSVAHLAGAMGVPVWLLNRYDTDWRWLREREDSPWYPSMRIFRQRDRGNWRQPVAELAAELRSLESENRRKRDAFRLPMTQNESN